MKQSVLAFAFVTFCVAHPAFADRIDNRQHRQEQRIEHGVTSGELNAHEAARLEKQQARIDALETKVKSDGVVTRREHAKIEIAQDHASHTIARKKHNRR